MGITEVLKRCDMLLGLDDSALAKVAGLPSCHMETYQAEAGLFKEGEVAENLYVLDEGKVNLTMTMVADPLQSAVVETVTKGGIFGWSALVAPHILTYSAICMGPSRVLVVKGKELRSLMDSEPFIGYEVMRGLVRVIGSRLRHTQRLCVNAGQAMIL